jgi:hypothetical protein
MFRKLTVPALLLVVGRPTVASADLERSAQRLPGSAVQFASVAHQTPPTADSLERFTGSFALDSATSDAVPAAIERTVAPMNLIVRSVARRRLTRLNLPSPRLDMSVSSTQVEIRYLGHPPVRLPRTSIAIDWRNAEGENMRVQLLTSDAATEPTLREQYDTKDGRRLNEYQLDSEARRVRVRVTVTGPRLTIPLTYTLVYRRA